MAFPVQRREQPTNRGPQLGDGVLGRDRIQHRVESRTRTRLPSNPTAFATTFTSSSSRRGRSEARRRFGKPTNTVGWKPSGATVRPAAADQRKLQPVQRLPVTEALKGLQQHHRGNHPRWDRRPAAVCRGEQVRKVVVQEQFVPLIGQ